LTVGGKGTKTIWDYNDAVIITYLLSLTIRMLYDDDISLKELTNSLFKFQYSFVHPYEPGVFVIHTLLNEVPVFVMVHLLHYLGKT
jgi:hypothetical protein